MASENCGQLGQLPAPDNGDKATFPEGMRVLAVDDDRVCLRVIEAFLRQCRYNVTVTTEASEALRLLRENKNGFDIVITDVHMDDMDGFRLLEIISLEMDVPVIMMSSNDDKNTVMKGIKHGARDYLLKPIRKEEIQNIWQHVLRKSLSQANESIVVEGGSDQDSKPIKRQREQSKDKEDATSNNSEEDYSSQKKQRVIWTPELHKKFIAAIHGLGVEKAVPKKILEVMNEPGLSRENVASHLQKFRNALKKNSSRVSQKSNDNMDSDGIGGNSSNTTILSFNGQDQNNVSCFENSGFNSNINSGMIQFGHGSQNTDTFSTSLVNPKPLSLPLKQQGTFLHQYPDVPVSRNQMQKIIHMSGLRGVQSNSMKMDMHHLTAFGSLNYKPFSPKPKMLNDHMDISSQIPSFGSCNELNQIGLSLPGCTSNSHPNSVFFGVSGSPCPILAGASTEQSVLFQHNSSIGQAQTLLPGQSKAGNFTACNAAEDIEFVRKMTGAPMEMQCPNMDNFLLGDHAMSMHLCPDCLETDSIFHPSSCSSKDEDLSAAIKQDRQTREVKGKKRRLGRLFALEFEKNKTTPASTSCLLSTTSSFGSLNYNNDWHLWHKHLGHPFSKKLDQ